MTQYTIRQMNREDASSLASLDKLCFSVPWSEKSFCEEAENEKAVYYVAEDNGEIIGYIGFWNIIDEGHITNIAVHPDYRRRKIASALLEMAARTAIKNKLVLLTLEVRNSNTAAQGLYKSFGFSEVGKRRGYYREPVEDAVIMTLMMGENEE